MFVCSFDDVVLRFVRSLLVVGCWFACLSVCECVRTFDVLFVCVCSFACLLGCLFVFMCVDVFASLCACLCVRCA